MYNLIYYILEQGLQLEGTSKNSKFSYLLGVRNRSNRNLLSRQDTKGNYVPSSADFQALLNYQFSPKWQAELLSNISQTKFTLLPQSSQLTTSVFSPVFSATETFWFFVLDIQHTAHLVTILCLVAAIIKIYIADHFRIDETQAFLLSASYEVRSKNFEIVYIN